MRRKDIEGVRRTTLRAGSRKAPRQSPRDAPREARGRRAGQRDSGWFRRTGRREAIEGRTRRNGAAVTKTLYHIGTDCQVITVSGLFTRRPTATKSTRWVEGGDDVIQIILATYSLSLSSGPFRGSCKH